MSEQDGAASLVRSDALLASLGGDVDDMLLQCDELAEDLEKMGGIDGNTRDADRVRFLVARVREANAKADFCERSDAE